MTNFLVHSLRDACNAARGPYAHRMTYCQDAAPRTGARKIAAKKKAGSTGLMDR